MIQSLSCAEAIVEKQGKPLRVLADLRREECLKYLSNTTILENMGNQDIIILLDTGTYLIYPLSFIYI